MSKWKNVLSGLAIIIGVIMLASLLWDDSKQEAPEQVREGQLRGIIPASEYLTMTPEEFAERLREDGYDETVIATAVANKHDNQEVQAARLARWREAELHWEYVDAFQASMKAMMEEKVIGVKESRDFCYKAPQWQNQLVAAQEYVAAYREVEPTVVAETPRLWKLEQEAERALELVMAAECVGLPSSGGLATSEPVTRPALNQEILRTGTDEEILAELSRDPCFKGRVVKGEIVTTYWDDACILESRKLP